MTDVDKQAAVLEAERIVAEGKAERPPLAQGPAYSGRA